MLVGGSGQFPWGKPPVEKKTAFSVTVPEVSKNALSLRHISCDAVRYEMVSVPQNIVPLYWSLVSSDPLTVPLARWPSILNSPENDGEVCRSFFRLARNGSTPQLDSNVPLHSPVTGGVGSPGPLGSWHAGRQDKAAATSRDRYIGRGRAKQGRYPSGCRGFAVQRTRPVAAGYRIESGRTKA
jgi:hypothetical protein